MAVEFFDASKEDVWFFYGTQNVVQERGVIACGEDFSGYVPELNELLVEERDFAGQVHDE